MFGGVSPEHEVSIITGLQVLEHLDRALFEPHVVYVDKKGFPFYLPHLETRRDFADADRKPITFGTDAKGGFIRLSGFFGKKIYPVSAYLAFHGGSGETGPIQGLLESLSLPYTSSSLESLSITMNKQLTKEVVSASGISTVPGLSLSSAIIRQHIQSVLTDLKKLSLPVIIKPVHLGSSIGISIAKTATELEKSLLTAAQLDSEILVESLLSGFDEYNIAVRMIGGRLEVSAIERPKSQDEILSFADKYQRGGKKKTSGMASLDRNLPAKIDPKLKSQIESAAKAAFLACRCKGMVRIDFMLASKKLYLTEINPIPGSMAFYLWEAAGISFKRQITDLVNQSIVDGLPSQRYYFDYSTDIVSRFISQK